MRGDALRAGLRKNRSQFFFRPIHSICSIEVMKIMIMTKGSN